MARKLQHVCALERMCTHCMLLQCAVAELTGCAVAHMHLLQTLHQLARHGTNICAPMSLDLCNIREASYREAEEFSP
jgi:hypothetical protein